MTQLIITLDIDNDSEYGKDGDARFNGPAVSWQRFLNLLHTYTPEDKYLSIRDGLSAPIDHDLMIGHLHIEVQDPYVPEPQPREFAVGTILMRDESPNHEPSLYFRGPDGVWSASYGNRRNDVAATNLSDRTFETLVEQGTVTIIHDPAVNGDN